MARKGCASVSARACEPPAAKSIVHDPLKPRRPVSSRPATARPRGTTDLPYVICEHLQVFGRAAEPPDGPAGRLLRTLRRNLCALKPRESCGWLWGASVSAGASAGAPWRVAKLQLGEALALRSHVPNHVSRCHSALFRICASSHPSSQLMSANE